MRVIAIRVTGLILGALPAVYLIALLITANLGVNPVEKLTHQTGQWALILLLASLSITPIFKLSSAVSTKTKPIFFWRKYFGLYAFFYAVCHFLIYLLLDLSLDFELLFDDIKDRPYITVGFIALMLLVPLAATSTQKARKKLGRRWITLHKLVYVAAALALLHYYWRIRADYVEWYIYVSVFFVLMLWRLLPFLHKRWRSTQR